MSASSGVGREHDEPNIPRKTMKARRLMPHAIIRGANGWRHEVDFGDAPVRVDIYASEETVEIFIEADFDTLPEKRRRLPLLNIPRHLFSEATASAARRAANPVLHPRHDE
jgi:hypothetical protein